MTDAVHANLFTLQISDVVRLVVADQRPCIPPYETDGMLTKTVADIVMSVGNARALRDMLVQYVKDDVPPMETPNV